MSVTSEQQLAKIESEIWVTRLPSMSHPPPSIWRHRITCLSLKNASAPWGQTVARWPPITISRVSYIQYLLACKKSQRSNPYNMVKSGLTRRRVFRRRHLGRRVTAVTCLRWPTVISRNRWSRLPQHISRHHGTTTSYLLRPSGSSHQTFPDKSQVSVSEGSQPTALPLKPGCRFSIKTVFLGMLIYVIKIRLSWDRLFCNDNSFNGVMASLYWDGLVCGLLRKSHVNTHIS